MAFGKFRDGLLNKDVVGLRVRLTPTYKGRFDPSYLLAVGEIAFSGRAAAKTVQCAVSVERGYCTLYFSLCVADYAGCLLKASPPCLCIFR